MPRKGRPLEARRHRRVLGYGGGVISRYSDVPDLFPRVEHFHTIRLNQPASKEYTTEALRFICDLWKRRGCGLTNVHSSTGDIILLGCRTVELEPIFYELTHSKFAWDLGGSGSALRTSSCCIGKVPAASSLALTPRPSATT